MCGGLKVTPSATAFEYCSWCGAFIDWNHQVAYETRGSRQPGPQHQALKLYLTPQIEAARLRRDPNALEAAHRQLYELHVTDCPAAYSPRVGDPGYRGAIVGYHARADSARLLDERCGALEGEMIRVGRTMFWIERPEGRFVRPDRFFAVYDRFEPFQQRVDEVVDASGALALHPDAPPASLLHKIARSAFLQAWMPVLDAETGQQALARTGLAGEYAELAPPRMERRACGGCGAGMQIAAGAQCVMCEQCGALLDAATGDVPCVGCGAPLTTLRGARRLQCPYCRTELQLVR